MLVPGLQPVLCYRAFLVAQMVKNLPAVQETWVGKIPWRRERQPIPVFSPGDFHRQTSHGPQFTELQSRTQLSDSRFSFFSCYNLCKVLEAMPDINIHAWKALLLVDACTPPRPVPAWLCHFGSASASVKRYIFNDHMKLY